MLSINRFLPVQQPVPFKGYSAAPPDGVPYPFFLQLRSCRHLAALTGKCLCH